MPLVTIITSTTNYNNTQQIHIAYTPIYFFSALRLQICPWCKKRKHEVSNAKQIVAVNKTCKIDEVINE